jgi:hypothetical protein
MKRQRRVFYIGLAILIFMISDLCPLTSVSWGDTPVIGGGSVNYGASLPDACSNGELAVDSDAGSGTLYICIAGSWVSTAAAGSGTVTSSGTPTNHQWPGWTTDTNLKGFTIAASKPVCTDASGDPAACAGTEGVWAASGHNHSGTYQPADADLSYLAGFTPSDNVKTILNAANNAAIKSALGYYTSPSDFHMDDILTALGIASEATHFGTFTGTTIPDNQTAKAAIQALETAIETKLPIVAAGGTVDAITADYTPDITLSSMRIVAFVASGANTSATPTFAPDGLTAHTIVRYGGQALVAGDIPAALAVCLLQYNLANTRWELLNPAQPNPTLNGTFTFANGASPGSFYVLEGSGGGTDKIQIIGPATVTAGGRVQTLKDETGQICTDGSVCTGYAPSTVVTSSISDSDTTHCPDGNSVFDALAAKLPINNPAFTGAATGTSLALTGNLTGLMPSIIVLVPSGTSTDVPSETVLTHADDSSAANAYVGMTLYNITDGVSGTVTASTNTTITVAAGSMSWANTNVYQLGPGPSQSGSMFYVAGNGTLLWPNTVGYGACVMAEGTAAVKIDFPANMVFTGTLNTAVESTSAAEYIAASGSTTDDFICIQNKTAILAKGLGKRGTWTQE